MTKPLCKDCPHNPQYQSNPMHNMYFSWIRAAYHHWPEHYKDFQPTSENHLRAWLLCQREAKWRNEKIVAAEMALTESGRDFIQRAFEAAGTYAWIFPVSHGAVIVSPKSMKFDKMPHKDRVRVVEAAEHKLCEVFYLSNISQLKKEYENAA